MPAVAENEQVSPLQNFASLCKRYIPSSIPGIGSSPIQPTLFFPWVVDSEGKNIYIKQAVNVPFLVLLVFHVGRVSSRYTSVVSDLLQFCLEMDYSMCSVLQMVYAIVLVN